MLFSGLALCDTKSFAVDIPFPTRLLEHRGGWPCPPWFSARERMPRPKQAGAVRRPA